MKWNEFAKKDCELRKAFQGVKYTGVTNCNFIFDILDKLQLEEGLRIVAIRQGEWLGDTYNLLVIPNEMADSDPLLYMNDGSDIWSHITIEESEMGAWQACILDFAVAWMPLYWHGGYLAKKYMFSGNTLRSLDKGRFSPISFDYKTFKDDSRLVPSVTMKGKHVVITHCYWSDWEGLVLWTDYATFDGNGKLIYKHLDEELDDSKPFADKAHKVVLFEYDCGICF